MVLSTITSRVQVQPSTMRMLYRIPIRILVNYEIGGTATAIIDLNVICTLVNYVAQSIILVQKYQCSIKDYPPYLDWITFAAAMISCVGTVSSLIKYKNRPPHKGRWFNFLFSLLLVAYTGHALAVHSDPRLWASVCSTVLLYVTKANSVYKKEYYLLGDTIVPISGLFRRGDVITAVAVSAEHAHLVNSLNQGGRNVTILVSGGEGVMTNLRMMEENSKAPFGRPLRVTSFSKDLECSE
ncbi:hypothetical protein POM88_050556 [Heracleum sosnowskyi]|uniref:Uncharacterized protein n=1 Tax=Heracleum sosnowskyi TaxID=360622 RepID=A0AAD8M0I7_9APIA|nr:hypothetical protein POM88_050556 [Heracleum sosnowskyi]